MKQSNCKIWVVIGSIMMLMMMGVLSVSAQTLDGDVYAKGRFIVKFKHIDICDQCQINDLEEFKFSFGDYYDSIHNLNIKYRVVGVRPLYPFTMSETMKQALPSLSQIYIFVVDPNSDVEAICEDYNQDPHVQYCQPDYKMTKTALGDVPSDPFYSEQWSLETINFAPAFEISQGAGVVVAVIDTGVDYTHEDLIGNIWVNEAEIPDNGIDDDLNGYVDDVRGFNFVGGELGSGSDPMDVDGHGTHVAGLIAARANNSGIVGVASEAKIMPLKVLDDNGEGNQSHLAQAIVYASQNGAQVINGSLSCPQQCQRNPLIEDVIKFVHSQGRIIIFASGDNNEDVNFYSPANMLETITVAGSGIDDTDKAIFSNYGGLIDVSAPSEDMISLLPDNAYGLKSGTSMAAGLVSGIAALILSNNLDYTNEDVRQILRAATDDIFTADFDTHTGHGRVNAAKAMNVKEVVRTKIERPFDNEILDQQSTPFLIEGTVEGFGLVEFFIEYKKDDATSGWVLLEGPRNDEVSSVRLADLLTENLSVGSYFLRLRAVTAEGVTFKDVVRFTVVVGDEDVSKIAGNKFNQHNPDMEGDLIVYQDDRNGNWDIFMLNVETGEETQITDHPADQDLPAISGNRIIWRDSRNGVFDEWDIYMHDLISGAETRITKIGTDMHGEPDIFGNYVVWQDFRDGQNMHVYYYNIGRDIEEQITKSSPGNHIDPQVSGDHIVWRDDRSSAGQFHVYAYDVTTFTESILDPQAQDQGAPSILGSKVVAAENGPIGADIYTYDLDLGNKQRITNSQEVEFQPVVSAKKIAWMNAGNMPDGNIYLHDLASSEQSSVTSNSFLKESLSVSGERVVWAQENNGQWDIYLFDPDLPPVLVPVADQIVSVGDALQVTVSAMDPEGGNLILSAHLEDGSAVETMGASFVDQEDGSGIFAFTPKEDQNGNDYFIIFQAEDPKGQIGSDMSVVHVNDLVPPKIVQPAMMTTPALDSTIAHTSVTFQWSEALGRSPSGKYKYNLSVGTTPGGNDIFSMNQQTSTSKKVKNIPLLGEPIYIRLMTTNGPEQVFEDYVYQTALIVEKPKGKGHSK